jgi:hypothetical protein
MTVSYMLIGSYINVSPLEKPCHWLNVIFLPHKRDLAVIHAVSIKGQYSYSALPISIQPPAYL